jgi:site-specific recombinase XerC
VVKIGKTPVLTTDETRQLLDSIDTRTIAGKRDLALIGVMVFSFARVSAVVGMNVEDYFPKQKRWWLRLHEKGGKYHEVPAHHNAEEYVDAYIQAAGIADDKKGPLFRSLNRKRHLTGRRLRRIEVVALNKQQTQVLGHAETFAAINEKIKEYNPDEIILTPIMRRDAFLVGSLYG